MSDWDALETPLVETPLFPVEAPDGRKDLTELARQSWFVAFMGRTQPHIAFHANANAGKRNPTQARREGITSGVFDMTVGWDCSDTDAACTAAYLEFKGYDKSGRPGKLSANQIEWGNRWHAMGFHVASFFSAQSAIAWLRDIGCPIRGTIS